MDSGSDSEVEEETLYHRLLRKRRIWGGKASSLKNLHSKLIKEARKDIQNDLKQKKRNRRLGSTSCSFPPTLPALSKTTSSKSRAHGRRKQSRRMVLTTVKNRLQIKHTELTWLDDMYDLVRDLEFDRQIEILVELFKKFGLPYRKKDIVSKFRTDSKFNRPITFYQFCISLKGIETEYECFRQKKIKPDPKSKISTRIPFKFLISACLRKLKVEKLEQDERQSQSNKDAFKKSDPDYDTSKYVALVHPCDQLIYSKGPLMKYFKPTINTEPNVKTKQKRKEKKRGKQKTKSGICSSSSSSSNNISVSSSNNSTCRSSSTCKGGLDPAEIKARLVALRWKMMIHKQNPELSRDRKVQKYIRWIQKARKLVEQRKIPLANRWDASTKGLDGFLKKHELSHARVNRWHKAQKFVRAKNAMIFGQAPTLKRRPKYYTRAKYNGFPIAPRAKSRKYAKNRTT